MNTETKTATLELSEFRWKVIGLALNDSSIMPNACKQLAEEIAELVAVQIGGAN